MRCSAPSPGTSTPFRRSTPRCSIPRCSAAPARRSPPTSASLASDADAATFGASIADWPPFPDSVEALAYLKQHGLLMVLSNVDRASFAGSARRLGDPFHAVVTAEDVGSYKPAPAHFERALALLAEEGIAQGQVLHVAQSLFHDVQPGRAAGLTTCWIDRRAGRAGGATPPVDVEPDMTFTDLASLAAWHRVGTG